MVSDRRDVLRKCPHPLPDEWAWEWFTDVMDVEGGTQPPASSFVDTPRPGYVRLVQIRDFESDGHITYIPDSFKWRKCCVQDVLIARYGAALGRICSGLEGAYNVALAKVIASERVFLPFAYHLLRSNYFQAPLHAGGGRSAQEGFNKSGLAVIPLPIPPLAEQRAIAHILGTLDDKIELNRRTSETLEAMARAIFQSWFVDFDVVRAKAEGRDCEIPAQLSALFPNRILKSELGAVPMGWTYTPLGNLVTLTRGTTYKSGLKGIPGPVLLGLGSIRRNGGFKDDNLSTYGGDSPAKLRLGPGELFVSLKDVTQSADLLGAVARVPSHIECGRLAQDTVKLTVKSSTTSPAIIYQTLLSPVYRDYCRSHATGTTNLGLSREDFLRYPIVQPTEEVQAAFDEVVGTLDARRVNGCRRSSHARRSA